MIICRINEKQQWIFVRNVGGVKPTEGSKATGGTAVKTKIPVYDGYWDGTGWRPESQRSEALVFTHYELAKTYLLENRTTMEQAGERNEAE